MFEVTRAGERVFGLAAGVDRRHLKRLRDGEPEPERDLDLHGLAEREAQEDVTFELSDAYEAGERCVRIVHGRGTHSPGGGVLKEAVLDWLQQPPLAKIVLAFASPGATLGGAGALLVLLRRRRDGRGQKGGAG